MNNAIDFVIPWVDGGDHHWKELFEQYSPDENTVDARTERYRDWGLLKYWFRGVEKYSPWVRKIHFITQGHVPEWLDVKHPKLNIVKHSDYIDKKYLPVFSSHPIELMLNKIDELAERFVYFNDDFFLINAVSEEDFFKGGLPNDMAVMNAINGFDLKILNIFTNNLFYVNRNFSKNEVIRKNIWRWFNLKYGSKLIRNFLLLSWCNFTGFYDHHLPQSFLKSTFEDVWEKEPSILQSTMSSKFRSGNDVNQYLFRYWQLCSGKFAPTDLSKNGQFFQISDENCTDICDFISSSNKKIVVLNDGEIDDFELKKSSFIDVFNKKLPERSQFESC